MTDSKEAVTAQHASKSELALNASKEPATEKVGPAKANSAKEEPIRLVYDELAREKSCEVDYHNIDHYTAGNDSSSRRTTRRMADPFARKAYHQQLALDSANPTKGAKADLPCQPKCNHDSFWRMAFKCRLKTDRPKFFIGFLVLSAVYVALIALLVAATSSVYYFVL